MNAGPTLHARWPWCSFAWSGDAQGRGVFACVRCGHSLTQPINRGAALARLSTFAIEHSGCTLGCAPPRALPPPKAKAPTPPSPPPRTIAAPEVQKTQETRKLQRARLSDHEVEILAGLVEGARALTATDPIRRVELLRPLAAGLPAQFPAEGLGATLEALDVHGRARLLREHCEELHAIAGCIVQYDWSIARSRRSPLSPGRATAATKRQRNTWRGEGPAPWFHAEVSLLYWLACPDADAQDRALHHLLMAFGVDCDDDGEDRAPVLHPYDVQEFAATVRRFGVSPADVQFVRAAVETSEGLLRREGVLWVRPADAPTEPIPSTRPRAHRRREADANEDEAPLYVADPDADLEVI